MAECARCVSRLVSSGCAVTFKWMQKTISSSTLSYMTHWKINKTICRHRAVPGESHRAQGCHSIMSRGDGWVPPDTGLYHTSCSHFREIEAPLLQVIKRNIRRPFKRTASILLLTANALTAPTAFHSMFKIHLNERGWIRCGTSSEPERALMGGGGGRGP